MRDETQPENDDPYGVLFQRLDAASTLALIRARPPQRELGAFMRLVDGSRRQQRDRTIAPGPRMVEVMEAVLAEDEARLVLVEVELERWVGTWGRDGCRQAVEALDVRWPQPSPWIRRVRDRLAALDELRALDLPPATVAALEYLVALGRPPLIAEDAFLSGLESAAPGVDAAALRAAVPLLPAAATAARLLDGSVERAAALLDERRR